MRILSDYAIDKIFHGTDREKPSQTYSTVTSMLTPGKDELHEIFSPKDSGPSSRTYEIIMLSLCGTIFVLAMGAIALKTIRKRVLRSQSPDLPGSATKDRDAAETGVACITTSRKYGAQILTAEVTGPVCIRYIPEKEMPAVEFLTLEAKPNSNTVLSFSFASSIEPFDTSPKK